MEKGDILIIISSSGNSNNVKNVLRLTNKKGFKTIGICGFKGGYLRSRCSIPIYAKINNYGISDRCGYLSGCLDSSPSGCDLLFFRDQ